MKKIKFLHTADLHLDSPMVGLSHLPEKIYKRLLNSTFVALKQLVDAAIDNKVDFVIIAGDIYDGEDRSIRAQVLFSKEMERLNSFGIPVFLIHGNHDHLGGTWAQIPLPFNVTLFGPEVEMHSFVKGDTKVHLYGFSYPRRQVMDKKIDDYQKIQGADFHIGILHGNDGGNSTHGNYAPFSVTDLLEKGFDYWALGHIHKQRIISEFPPILYPGNIQGRHHKEAGPKGCYEVTLSETDVQLNWIDTADIEWDTLEIDVSQSHDFHDILRLCLDTINQFRVIQLNGKIIKLILNNLQPIEGKESLINGDLLDILQENEHNEENFIWVSSIETNELKTYDKEALKGEDGFFKELFETIETFTDIDSALEPLYQHHLARKYISRLNEGEQENILLEAEKLVIQYLFDK
ncbi:metallophosphoesterase family protein [Neobacillus sp. D3-1R]|uniref:metallophosphoesterase family protein n=1 Tax=Neobacillus sp. D3-1R TaxID=3445778 RepID=UPI003F9FA6FD